jgi:anti-sigma factor RsiW
MSEHDLRAALADLEAEIERGGADAEHRARLEQLRARLALEIEQETDAERTQELAQTVRDAVRRYEVEHPALTGVLGRILRALESMGI